MSVKLEIGDKLIKKKKKKNFLPRLSNYERIATFRTYSF